MSEASRRDAQHKAWALRKSLKGAGWHSKTWENIGWHYACVLKAAPDAALSVHPVGTDPETYYASLSDEWDADELFWPQGKTASFADPNEAVANKIRQANKFLTEIRGMVRSVKSALGKGTKR